MKTNELIHQLEQLHCRIDIKMKCIDIYIDAIEYKNWQCNRVYYDQTKFKPLHLPPRLQDYHNPKLAIINEICQQYVHTPIIARGKRPAPRREQAYNLTYQALQTLEMLNKVMTNSHQVSAITNLKFVLAKLLYQYHCKAEVANHAILHPQASSKYYLNRDDINELNQFNQALGPTPMTKELQAVKTVLTTIINMPITH